MNAFLVSLPITFIVAIFFGIIATIVPVMVVLAGLVLWEGRQTGGLGLQYYQAILDKRSSQVGDLYICGEPIVEPKLILHQNIVVGRKTL